MIRVLFTSLLLAGAPALPEKPMPEEGAVQLYFPCIDKACSYVAVPAQVLDGMSKTNDQLASEVVRLRNLIEAAKPQCGTLEVVPKKHVPVPGPRDFNS
jgi:hypothetical protein